MNHKFIISNNIELLKRYYLYLQLQDIISCHSSVVEFKYIESVYNVINKITNVEEFYDMLEEFGFDEIQDNTFSDALKWDTSL